CSYGYDRVVPFSTVNWFPFQLSKCRPEGQSGSLFDRQLVPFSLDKNSYRANLHSITSKEYIENYRNALSTYRELLQRYPAGDMATNARENIPIIEEKLRSPDARRDVPEGRWTWDTAEKLPPPLEDIFRLLRLRR
ncbi:MAG: hypothetical protein NT169_26825, partial [Chloroflexi bacterium]|nr:hypothetical protein [Chloroflexota bacterium]